MPSLRMLMSPPHLAAYCMVHCAACMTSLTVTPCTWGVPKALPGNDVQLSTDIPYVLICRLMAAHAGSGEGKRGAFSGEPAHCQQGEPLGCGAFRVP
jgi:hypothetical protein